KRLIERPLHTLLYGLVVLYLFDRLRELAPVDAFLPRLIFLVELLTAVAFLLWFYFSKRVASNVEAGSQKMFRAVRKAVPFAIAVFAAALFANAAGFVSLSGILGNGVLRSTYATLIIYALSEVIKGVVI